MKARLRVCRSACAILCSWRKDKLLKVCFAIVLASRPGSLTEPEYPSRKLATLGPNRSVIM